MSIEWEQFAQRRNIKLSMFENVIYKDYVAWCYKRKVVPVSEEKFESTNKKVHAQPAIEKVVVLEKPSEEPPASLKKMNKAALVELAKKLGVKITDKDTKNKIITKIKLSQGK